MTPPDVLLLDFLDHLPTTIRSTVLYGCCFGVEAAEFVELGTLDNLKILRDFLDIEGSLKVFRCAQLVGVVELCLEPPTTDEKQHEEIYKETGVEVFREAAMMAPLTLRHFAGARSQFYELRQGGLSAANLKAWYMLLQGSRPLPEASE